MSEGVSTLAWLGLACLQSFVSYALAHNQVGLQGGGLQGILRVLMSASAFSLARIEIERRAENDESLKRKMVRSLTMQSLKGETTVMRPPGHRKKKRRPRPRFMIDPRTSKFAQYWDLVTLVALVFTAIVTPFEV